MPALKMLVGLPASGKSTWAIAQVAKDATTKRVNKDDLRAMIDGGTWSRDNEQEILAVRDILISRWLQRGFNVIVDDTNFAPMHQQRLMSLAAEADAMFSKKFFDVSLEEAIKRDAARANSVGEDVIRSMHDKYLKPEPATEIYTPPEGKQRAIICDIDGTLAHMTSGRSPYDYSRVSEDSLDLVVNDILNRYNNSHTIILLSGRESGCRKETEIWLRDNNVYYNQLYMRAEGDNRKDSIVKKELFDEYVRNNYNVSFVLDDRQRVVDMWRRELGLKVLQVAEGDF